MKIFFVFVNRPIHGIPTRTFVDVAVVKLVVFFPIPFCAVRVEPRFVLVEVQTSVVVGRTTPRSTLVSKLVDSIEFLLGVQRRYDPSVLLTQLCSFTFYYFLVVESISTTGRSYNVATIFYRTSF